MIFKLNNIFPLLKTLKPVILSIIIFSLFAFSACSDDPVTPQQPEFDPPRFEWRSMEISGERYAGMWALDTNIIFMINHNEKTLVKIENGNLISYPVGDYLLNDIKGLSNNEIYLFGTEPLNGILTIIKWNGGGFEYFQTDIAVTDDHWLYVRGCVVNSNEIWICCQNGIAKFDGAKFINYSYENPELVPNSLIYYPENKVQYIYSRWESDSLWHTGFYEFVDTAFVKKIEIVGNPYITNNFTFLHHVGGNKLGIQDFYVPFSICIQNFNGFSFSNYFCYGKEIISSGRSETGVVSGINQENFIFLATAENFIFEPTSRLGILHWDGNKVSKEIGVAPFSSPFNYTSHILFCINSNKYLIYEPRSHYGIPTIYIGTKN